MSRLPPGRIFTDRASTKGIPEVVSGSSITVEPLDYIILRVPSLVHTMPMKFVAVKSIPSLMGRYNRLGEWLTIDSESTGYLS